MGNFRNGNVSGDILGLRGGPYTQNVIRTGYKFNLRDFKTTYLNTLGSA